MSKEKILDLSIYQDIRLLARNVVCKNCGERRAYFKVRYSVPADSPYPYNRFYKEINLCLDCAKKFVIEALEEMLK